MSSIIQLKNVDKSYQDANQKRMIFKDLNLTIEQNSSLAIIGRSGTGKSTLLNLISGIDIPDRGEIVIQDQNIVVLNENQRTLYRRQHIGFIFQAYNLIPTLTVAENVRMPLELCGLSQPDNIETLVRAKLTDVGLADRYDSFPEQLSGGEQQRVAIARAIIHQPALILADEPTGNLDEENGQRVLNLLFDLVRREGKTLIIVTHSHEIAAMASDTLRVTELGEHD